MNTYTKLEDLPEVLRIEEVAKVLRISRSSAYSLAHSQNFPVINPLGGKSMRIPKDAFIKWLESHTQY
jgi:excisionase family DNA binding protein